MKPEVQVWSYSVSVLDQNDINYSTHLILVEHRGRGWWAVRNGALILSRTGRWDPDLPATRASDNWMRNHRFTREDALRRAKLAAPRLVEHAKRWAEKRAG
jgi:hypothetical protein